DLLRRGTRGMDAERVTMGQGWPFVTRPRSSAGGREPRRSRGRMPGNVSFAYFSFERKVRRREAQPEASAELGNRPAHPPTGSHIHTILPIRCQDFFPGNNA